MKATKKESSFSYHVAVGTNLFNPDGYMRPDSYLRLASDVADEHVKNFHAHNAMLLKEFGTAWVLLSCQAHLIGQVRQNDVLTAVTWCTGRKHGMYGRDYIFRNEEGEEVLGIGSIWTLLDLNKRTFYKEGEAEEVMEFGTEPPRYEDKKIRFRTRGYAMEEVDSQVVRPSWIDGSGHLNNCRYGDFLYDNMSPTARNRLGEATQMEFYFIGEFSEGDTVRLRHYEDDHEVLVAGGREEEDAFVARLIYGP